LRAWVFGEVGLFEEAGPDVAEDKEQEQEEGSPAEDKGDGIAVFGAQ
jgi:hypothetical protein